ncbi:MULTISPECIES: flagellar hook-length control protein FliK [Pantoea]|jgi:flagellar hook-length control protein FliK|uniref:flagellar hook-length control protein FliK n=1 Tax=Pantoea TaxID=53335 RepID=UPI000EA3E7A6|nr:MULTISPECIES: flagellar hook-length control protein FliK [Pantoea]MBZ6385470.1 flagellar hook-length control protein FliK [Pantoea piersonii]MBZ6398986.1 flagellar hook-length control protein FliK [Pantoea piersonii]MBZ6407516.1 flagellar hook-length control protein FliK [Pantoea piersonii]MBZ6425533.1 flagellar hook-length control protein FliK [Pantoea piersonii]NYB00943.1 flagellar hook-length control protein FliK [Pantoea piersonii]
MITLPNIVTTASAKGDVNSSDSADLLHSAKSLPQGFLTELGNRLLTLAKQQGNTTQSAESAEESQEASAPTGQLNALLTALDKPGSLEALLTPENIKAATKSADDKDKASAETLTSSDAQTMQALFAMLPVSPVAQSSATSVTTATASSGSETRRSAASDKVLSTLSQALGSSLAQSQPQQASTPAHAEAKTSQAALTATSGAAASTAATSTAPLTLDSSFQQVLSSFSKQDEKSASLTQTDSTALTSAPLSSSTAPLITQTASATTDTPSTPMLNAQLGSDEWQQALSQQIVMFSRNGQQNAELRLHPADLGAIQISLKLDNDQAQINMASSHSHVRAALEAALPQLRTALAENGINLGQSQVSSDSFAQGQGFQQQQQEARRDGQHGTFSLSQDDDSEITPIAVPAALQARILGTGAVDTFA